MIILAMGLLLLNPFAVYHQGSPWHFTMSAWVLSYSPVCLKGMKDPYIFCEPFVLSDSRRGPCLLNMLLTSNGPDSLKALLCIMHYVASYVAAEQRPYMFSYPHTLFCACLFPVTFARNVHLGLEVSVRERGRFFAGKPLKTSVLYGASPLPKPGGLEPESCRGISLNLL